MLPECTQVSESLIVFVVKSSCLLALQENMLLREKVGLKSTEHVQQVMLLGCKNLFARGGREDVPTIAVNNACDQMNA